MRSVGVREAKNGFSSLTAQVNETGSPLTVLRNNKPWVVIYPADAESGARRERMRKLRALTRAIEQGMPDEPQWNPNVSDKELLDEERVRRFG